ncbi:hypothetical protein GU700_11895 [Methylobacterium sp. NI91]|nr:hypothetical protein CLZ_11895 [Methylobacterium sp. CLZ]QIJ82598.1 hypothetical protein GU700_11895 [Methylobacterium sp. NI91]
MEHYRSVFATAAVMVIGLVATSPLIAEQNSGPSRAPRVAVDVVSESGDGWTDPPRHRTSLAAVTDVAVESRSEAGVMPSPRPASFTLLSAETAAFLTVGDFVKVDAAQRVQAVRRHRAAKVASRARPATAVETAAETSAPAQATTATQPQKAARIDPIGDILRGLGIGQDS